MLAFEGVQALGGACHSVRNAHLCVHQVDSPLQARLQEHMPVKTAVDTSKMLLSPMPGKLVSIAVKVGDKVAPGQELVVVEAMKMQNVLKSQVGAVVRAGTEPFPCMPPRYTQITFCALGVW